MRAYDDQETGEASESKDSELSVFIRAIKRSKAL